MATNARFILKSDLYPELNENVRVSDYFNGYSEGFSETLNSSNVYYQIRANVSGDWTLTIELYRIPIYGVDIQYKFSGDILNDSFIESGNSIEIINNKLVLSGTGSTLKPFTDLYDKSFYMYITLDLHLEPKEPDPPLITTETVEVFEVIPFDTEELEDPDLYIGETRKVQGVQGQLKITYLVTYSDGVEVERVEQSREIVTNAINEIIYSGTKKTPPETIPLNLNLENISASLENGSLLENGEIEITFTANSGYTLDGVILTYKQGNITKTTKISDVDNTRVFPVIIETMNSLSITGKANVITKQITTFNNVYHISSKELSELSSVRFSNMSTGEIVDYGTFITKLYMLPFEVPLNVIAGTGTVQLGNYNSNVETNILNDYQFTVDLGIIEVPEKYHNVYDYLQTRCFIYLPFTNRIEIEASYIIDCTIKIEYVINLYNGESTINIFSSKTDEPIHSETVAVANDIPFMQTATGKTVSDTKTVYNNGILNPFIIVERNIPYDKVDSVFGGELIENGLLSQFKGYVEINDFKMISKATSQEQSEIKTLLRNGVFINE